MIKFFHKLYLGWELTTLHYMIAAAGKGIDRFRGMSGKRTSEVAVDVVDLSSRIVTSSQEVGDVMWLSLALSYFLLC